MCLRLGDPLPFFLFLLAGGFLSSSAHAQQFGDFTYTSDGSAIHSIL